MSKTALVALPCDLWITIIRIWLESDLRTLVDLDAAFCNHQHRPFYLSWIKDMELEKYPSDALSSAEVVKGREARSWFTQWLVKRKIFITSAVIACANASYLKFLGAVVSANPQLLSKARSVTIKPVPAGVSALLENILRHAPSVTSCTCHGFNSVSGPWMYLPTPSAVTSIKFADLTDESLSWCLDFLNQKVYDQLPNLEELKMIGMEAMFFFEMIGFVLRACALLTNLRVLELNNFTASESDDDNVPDPSTWAHYPLAPNVDTLVLQDVMPDRNADLISFMLDRCPNVSALTVTTSDDNTLHLRQMIANLRYLDWTDQYAYFRIVAEAVDGTRFGDSFHNREDLGTQSAQTDDDAFFDQLARVLQQATLKRFECYLGELELESTCVLETGDYDLVCQLTNLTKLHFCSVHLTAKPEMWATILSLPVLENLELKACERLQESFVMGLARCVGTGVQSTSVKSLEVDHNDDADEYRSLCLMASRVFPALTDISLLFSSVPAAMILDAVFNMQSLRRIVVEGDGGRHFTATMTEDMWQAVASVTKCHRWEIKTQSFEWELIQCMIDNMGKSLHDLHVVVDDFEEQDELEETAKEYLRKRRFRLTYL